MSGDKYREVGWSQIIRALMKHIKELEFLKD